MKQFFKVIAQGASVMVPSKEEGGQTSKCTLVLQELGGKFENSFAITLFGEPATRKFAPGEIVYGVLRFNAHEYNGQWYQDVMVKELLPFNG